MSPNRALKIASILYIGLGLMVWSVLWLFPEVGIPGAQGNPNPETLILTARAWGDINGTMFFGVGLILFMASKNDGNPGAKGVMRTVLLANAALAAVLLGMATFHTVVLQHGPPPPVFIVCLISLVISIQGRKNS